AAKIALAPNDWTTLRASGTENTRKISVIAVSIAKAAVMAQSSQPTRRAGFSASETSLHCGEPGASTAKMRAATAAKRATDLTMAGATRAQWGGNSRS